MKLFRLIFSAILLINLVGCTNARFDPLPPSPQPVPPPRPSLEELGKWLETLPGVVSVEELLKGGMGSYSPKYFLIIFEQLIDPKNPAAGTFKQRVFLAHINFESPMVLEAEGYSAESRLHYAPNGELRKHYNANSVVVEHRYAGRSLPERMDWKYLTCQYAAYDLHVIRKALGRVYTGSWIATGTSKGGTNAMNYFMRYPNDLAAAVSYVGPICNGKDDPRFVTYMQNMGTPEMRQKIADFQREMIKRRNVLQPEFFPKPPRPTNAAETMTNDQNYEACIAEFAASAWQEEMDMDKIPGANATDAELIDFAYGIFQLDIIHLGCGFKKTPADNLRGLAGMAGSNLPLPLTHYLVQAVTELGYPAYFTSSIEDLVPDRCSWSKNTFARFGVPSEASTIQFSNELNQKMNDWLKNSDPRLICVHGGYDIWTAAAPDKNYFVGKSNMAIYIKEKGGHTSTAIDGLAPGDQSQLWAKLDSWVKQ